MSISVEAPTWDDGSEITFDEADKAVATRPGHHATWARPFPTMRCTGIVRNGPNTGERCQKTALYGATVCCSHGAQLPVVQKKARAMVEAARLRLFGNLDMATDILEDLLQNASSEAVRLKAVEVIYDRVGLRGGTEIDVTVTTTDPAEALRERLQSLRKRTIEGEITDRSESVIVNSSTDQPALEERASDG